MLAAIQFIFTIIGILAVASIIALLVLVTLAEEMPDDNYE